MTDGAFTPPGAGTHGRQQGASAGSGRPTGKGWKRTYPQGPKPAPRRCPHLEHPTLFLLTAELGHNSRRDSEELCSSLHTCHRKCRKEPPVGHTETHQHRDPGSPPACGPWAHLDLSSSATQNAAMVEGTEDSSEGGETGGSSPAVPLTSWVTPRESLPGDPTHQMGTTIEPMAGAG